MLLHTNAMKGEIFTVSPRSQRSNNTGAAVSVPDNKKTGEEVVKRRKISSAKEESENSSSGDEFFTLSPSHVTLGPGVRITSVAAGGRHTLILSGKLNVSWVSQH